MSSKKAPSSKRATLPRASDHTKAFTKDWTRLSHSGRFDMKRLKEAMLLLIANEGPLGRIKVECERAPRHRPKAHTGAGQS